MPNATEHRQAVYRNGSATCMARILGADAEPITQATIESITYTVALIDPADADADTPIENHAAVTLTVTDVVYDVLQSDQVWTADEVGYNFRHTIDVSAHAAFAIRGREYRIVYALQPASGQVILVVFRVTAI